MSQYARFAEPSPQKEEPDYCKSNVHRLGRALTNEASDFVYDRSVELAAIGLATGIGAAPAASLAASVGTLRITGTVLRWTAGEPISPVDLALAVAPPAGRALAQRAIGRISKPGEALTNGAHDRAARAVGASSQSGCKQ